MEGMLLKHKRMDAAHRNFDSKAIRYTQNIIIRLCKKAVFKIEGPTTIYHTFIQNVWRTAYASLYAMICYERGGWQKMYTIQQQQQQRAEKEERESRKDLSSTKSNVDYDSERKYELWAWALWMHEFSISSRSFIICIIIQAYTVHAQAIRRRCVIFVLMSRARTTINIRMLLLQQCAEEERLIWFTERNERAIYRTWSLLTYPLLQFYWRSRFSRASDAFLNWRVRLHTPTDSHISVNLNSGKRTNDSWQCRCQQQ